MSKIKITHPDRSADFVSGAFSDGVVVGDLLFVSGQASVDFSSSQFILGSVEEETARTLENLSKILIAAGSSLDQVVKSTVHLSDMADFKGFNEVYARYFSGVMPARTTVQSVLPAGIKVEIDCIAKIG
jgi:2-iminobutanoate/2-iminopropanoate deaminase